MVASEPHRLHRLKTHSPSWAQLISLAEVLRHHPLPIQRRVSHTHRRRLRRRRRRHRHGNQQATPAF